MPTGNTTNEVRSVRFSNPLVTRQVEYVSLIRGDERAEEGEGEREIGNGEGLRIVVIVVVSVGVAESNEQEG